MKRSFSQPSTSGESGKRSRLFSLQQALDLVYDSDEDEQDLADIYPESDLESVDSDVNSESSNEDEGLDVDLDLDLVLHLDLARPKSMPGLSVHQTCVHLLD